MKYRTKTDTEIRNNLIWYGFWTVFWILVAVGFLLKMLNVL